jgi:hypothetical protein
MLQSADLPEGFTVSASDLDGDWSLEFMTTMCANTSPSLLVGEVARRGVRIESADKVLLERVTRHSGNTADTVMDNARRLARECDPYRPDDSMEVIAEDLGGADSVLVGSLTSGRPNRWLLVRQGDLVAQLWLGEQSTESVARSYARKVADRLCAGTDTC